MAKWATTLAGLGLLLVTVSVAGSDFQCPMDGFFRKSGSCNEFYHCTTVDGYPNPKLYRCPQGFMFDDTQSKCVQTSTLTSTSGCMPHPRVNKHSRSRNISTEDSVEKGYDATDRLARYTTEGSTVSDTYEDPEVKGVAESLTVESPARAIEEELVDPVIEDDGILGPNQTINIHAMDARNISNETMEAIVSEQQNITGTVSDNAAEGILSLCDQVNSADAYFELVAGSPFLHESFGYKTHYNRIVQQYNRDIKKAHNNTYLWRRGSSIPLGLKQSHKKANEYKDNFKRKFAIYKEQIKIKASQKMNPDVIQRLESQIQDLTESIRREQGILQTNKFPALQIYLEESINSTKREIERLESEKNPNSEEILLRELANFLRHVKNEASEGESQVTQVLEKMDTLLENMQIEAQDFDKLENETKKGYKILNEEAIQIQNELKLNVENQERLDDKWGGLGEELFNLRHKESRVRKKIKEAEEKLEIFLEKKKIYCSLVKKILQITKNATKENIDEACISILIQKNITILNTKAEDTRLKKLHDKMKLIQGNQTKAVEGLASITPQRTGLSDTLPKQQRLVEIEFELYSLHPHDIHLENLQRGVSTARKSILILQVELHKLQEIFKSYVTKLQEMIDAAKAAANDDNYAGQRASIENELEELQTTLQNQVLNDINKCFEVKPSVD